MLKEKSVRSTNSYFAVISIIFALAICALATQVVFLSKKLEHLEHVVREREEADPLIPDDCPKKDEICKTTISKIIASPQKYHRRLIYVEGVYLSTFESSAIFEDARHLEHSRGIWIADGVPKSLSQKNISIVGQFYRGPTGHMDEYPGKLSNVKIIEPN